MNYYSGKQVPGGYVGDEAFSQAQTRGFGGRGPAAYSQPHSALYSTRSPGGGRAPRGERSGRTGGAPTRGYSQQASQQLSQQSFSGLSQSSQVRILSCSCLSFTYHIVQQQDSYIEDLKSQPESESSLLSQESYNGDLRSVDDYATQPNSDLSYSRSSYTSQNY